MDVSANYIVPTPPVNPLFASESEKNDPNILAYNTKGYSRLVRSLPDYELLTLQEDMKQVTEDKVKDLAGRINACQIVLGKGNTREIIVIALKALQMNLLTIEQIASLHMLDGAAADLLTHPTSYFLQKFNREGSALSMSSIFPIDINTHVNYPSKVETRHYTSLGLMSEKCKPKDYPKKYSKPILKLFFALTRKEWVNFCRRMEDPQNKIPESEKRIGIVTAPLFGCWSMLVAQVQSVIRAFHHVHVVDKLSSGEDHFESKMVVPSFSMLQILLEVKGDTLGGPVPKMVATYNRLTEGDYANEKANEQIPVSLYFPERNCFARYRRENTEFKGLIDGWAHEGPFASIIHDAYHGLREMAMFPNIALARFRLASIAEKHPLNSQMPNSRRVSSILIDGELINSYPKKIDNIFTKRGKRQKFGDLFYVPSMKNELHPELKEAFIKDMVEFKEEWKENFFLGRKDLCEKDQEIYDRLENTPK